MFKKILIATDFSGASKAALYAAITLAARCLARVDALHVVTYHEDVFYMPPYPIPDTVRDRQADARMQDFFPEQLYPNSRRHVVVGNSIIKEILDYAKEEKCDLIVAGTHGRNKLAQLLLGSVTSKLVRISEVPVMIVQERKNSRGVYQAFNRILAPTDFSDPSMRSIEFGVKFANYINAEMHLLHVIDTPAINALHSRYFMPHVSIPDSCELNVDATMRKIIERYTLNRKPVFATRFGDPAHEILEYSKEYDCDFVVMGTHGRKGLERTLLGSVTATVLSNSTVPVFSLLGSHPV